MKIKNSFVTNSSSTAFIIQNISSLNKTIEDFVKENPQLIKQFVNEYDWNSDNPKYTQDKLIESAKRLDLKLPAGKSEYCVFGDEDGTLIGEVFDYILRDGGRSESFIWRFVEYLR